MKILITGGAGYVGNALTLQLCKDENIARICIYDNLSRGKHVFLQQSVKSPKLHFTQGDILDNDKLKKELQETDIVVHLVTVNHPTEHHYMEQVNHWGTANICNLIEEIPVKRFVLLSTSEIYDNSDATLTIATKDHPQTPYATSMLRAEKYVETLAQKCEVAIVRSAAVYGYNSAMHFASGLNKHVFEAKYNNLLQLDADGLHTQSAIHIDDLAKLLAKLATTQPKQTRYLATTTLWNGMEIYQTLQTCYPQLEATFTSHHLRLQDKEMEADKETKNLIGTEKTLLKAIQDIIQKTSY